MSQCRFQGGEGVADLVIIITTRKTDTTLPTVFTTISLEP